MERIINNIVAYIWAGLCIICLYGVIFKGAYWHLFTAGISYLMFKAMYIPKEKTTRK